MDKDCSLQDYINLFDTGVSVADLAPDKLLTNKEYIAFKTKAIGAPIKLVSYKKSFKKIPYDPQMFEFYKTHKLFWMIPLELPTGEIMGFIIRGFTSKDYRTISFTKHPLPFGFLEFGSEGFISDDHPVIIVEGVRDALFIKTFYPFCLSLNMGKISLDLLEILTKFIDNFILLTDMDETGRELVQVNRDLLLKKGKHVFIPTYKQKDVGSYFYVSEQEQEDFINSVLEVFNE